MTRKIWIAAVAAAVVGAACSVGYAQSGAKGDAPTRADLHRAMAALLEAQAAETPDAAKVKELSEKVQALRAKLREAGAVGPGAGAGMGPGRGQGMGAGMGPGRGQGMGAGMGPGCGQGMGRGPGWARGPGYGRGAGWGAGAGWGRGFVDRDGDGVCDNLQQRQGAK